MKLRRFKLPVKEPERVVKPKKARKIREPIYSVCYNGFGDSWALVNYAARDAYSKGNKLYLSRYTAQGADIHTRLKEIVNSLDLPVETEIVDDKGLTISEYETWNARYFPTKIKWKGSFDNKFCYQIDGNSSYWIKNPPDHDIEALTSWSNGTFTKIGKHMSVEDCIKIASESSMFFGVCSGMSHLCHSVGIPTYLIEYGLPVDQFHINKKYVLCKGTKKFIEKAKDFERMINNVKIKIPRFLK